ncbi:E1 ubiquitin-activating protein uba2, partial [Ascosphaera acerosa]
IAKEVASKFRPGARITAHLANIKDPRFDVDWFAAFDLVFNALDNLDARRHVNRMCLAADVPLVESGTTGFNGQNLTECYDCTTKPLPKSYPVCTIRSTPTQPIHCIVWAKSYLLPELFGKGEDEENFDHSEDADNELDNLRAEARALQQIRSAMGSPDFARRVFQKVFHDDIARLRAMPDMWKTKPPPEPLSFPEIDARCQAAGLAGADVARQGQRPWSLEENLTVFADALARLSRRYLDQAPAAAADTHTHTHTHTPAHPVIAFDKDDADTLDLVASAANLRARAFRIPTQSRFDTQQMAGNIIPAIATTNAMTAGLCVLQAFRALRGDYARAGTLFLERGGARAVNSDAARPPNPDCPVCSTLMLRVGVEPARATLRHVIDGLCRDTLGYADGELSVLTPAGAVVYDPDLEDNLDKTLAQLEVGPGSSLTVIDEGEDDMPRVNVELLLTAQP